MWRLSRALFASLGGFGVSSVWNRAHCRAASGEVTKQDEKEAKIRAVDVEAKGFNPRWMDDSWTSYARETVVMAALGFTSRIFMHWLNTTDIDHAERYRHAVIDRTDAFKNRGVVTVSNHVCALDDPLIPGAILSFRELLYPPNIRYIFCASNRCFRKAWIGSMLSSARVLPIERGKGMNQWSMVEASRRLRQCKCVHTFPEGTRAKDPKQMGPFKIGLGKLVADGVTDNAAPCVLPMYHIGFERLMDKEKGLQTGNRARIVIGEPIFFDAYLEEQRRLGTPDKEVYVGVTSIVEEAMQKLQAEAEQSHEAAQRARGLPYKE